MGERGGIRGPSMVGVVIEREEESKVKSRKSKVLVAEFGKRIGETTNNVVEYFRGTRGSRVSAELSNQQIIQ